MPKKIQGIYILMVTVGLLTAVLLILIGLLISGFFASPLTPRAEVYVPFTQATTGEKRETLIIGGDEAYPPYSYLEDGVAKGFDNDLIRAVANEMEMDVEFHLGPWSSVQQDLLDGNVDVISGMAVSESREEKFDFANPHSFHHSDIFVRRDSLIGSLEDLKGKEVIVQEGDIMHEFLLNNDLAGKIITVSNPGEALNLLSSGKHDAALMNSLVGAYYINSHQIKNLIELNVSLEEKGYGFAVAHSNHALIHQLDQALATVDNRGDYERLSEKWFAVNSGRFTTQRTRNLLIAFFGLSAFVGLIVLWVWVLRRKVRSRTNELRESEAKYFKLIDSATEGIVVCIDNKFVYMNPQAKKILEIDDRFENPIACDDFFSLEDSTGNKKSFSLSSDDPSNAVQRIFQIRTRKGSQRWINLNAVRIEWDSKPANLGYFSDVTEAKQLEEMVRESEREYRRLFNITPIGLVYYDKNLHVTNYNYRLLEILQVTPAQLENFELSRFEGKDILRAITGVFKQKEGYFKGPVPSILKGDDSVELFVNLHTTPVYDDDKEIIGGIGLIEDITEEVQNLHKLKSLEDRFSKAFLTSPDSININRLKDGLWIEINEGFTELTGFTRDDVIGKSSLDINIWANLENRNELIERLKSDGDVRNMEAQFRMKDGRIRVGLMSASVMEIEGEPCIISITRDITDRKQAEEALRISESRYRLTFEGVPVSIWEQDFLEVFDRLEQLRKTGVTDLHQYLAEHPEFIQSAVKTIVVKDVNSASLRMFEANSKEELMISIEKLFDKESYKNFEEELIAIWEGKSSYEGETINRTLDGKRMIVSLLINFPQKREDFANVLISISDITLRKQAEAELRESETRYRSIFNSVPISIWEEDFSTVIEFMQDLRDHGVNDLEMHFKKHPNLVQEAAEMVVINEVNDASISMFGAHNKTELLESLNKVFTEDGLATFRRELIAFWNKQTQFKAETTNLTVDGRVINVLLSTNIPSDSKGFSRVLVSVEDITERKKAEDKIRKQVEHLAALRAVEMAISASMDLAITLRVLINQSIQQLGVDASSILLFNPETQTLTYSAGVGFNTDAVENTDLKLGESYAGRVAKERKIIAANDLDTQHSELKTVNMNKEGFTNYIGVPLIAKGQVKGVLELFNRSPLSADPDWMSLLESMAGQAAIAIDNATLFDEVQRASYNLTKAYEETIEGWARALELRDGDTEGHSVRVAEMTLDLAKIIGIDPKEMINIRRGALLHDIGKMGIPDEILLKSSTLTDDEWEIMRRHPVYARDMLTPIEYLKDAIDIPFAHHEKWDGTGYPQGLKGVEIPLVSRIFSVVDCWDALRSNRPYRKAISDEDSWLYILGNSGKAYDPNIVEKFGDFLGLTNPQGNKQTKNPEKGTDALNIELL